METAAPAPQDRPTAAILPFRRPAEGLTAGDRILLQVLQQTASTPVWLTADERAFQRGMWIGQANLAQLLLDGSAALYEDVKSTVLSWGRP